MAERPLRPRHLKGHARSEWDRLAGLAHSMRVLTLADAPMLEAAACAYGEYRSALEACESGGQYYEARSASGATLLRANPAAATAADAWRRWTMALAAFGLSPASRSRVAKAPDPHALDPFEKYLGPMPATGANDPRKVLQRLS